MAISDPNPVAYLLDPLSEITRRERRNLLMASAVGLLVSKAALVPTQLSALGIEFSAPDQRIFVVLVALTVFYFFGAFVLYGLSDFLIWRKKYQDYLEGVEGVMQSWSQEDQHIYDELHQHIPDIGWLYQWSKPTAFSRILFEFVVPIVFGLYAASTLIFKVWRP